MVRLKYPTTLKDTLYNLHPKSGAGVDYCRGIIVGVVGALMASSEMDFAKVIEVVADHFPEGGRLLAPDSWMVPLGTALAARGKKWVALV